MTDKTSATENMFQKLQRARNYVQKKSLKKDARNDYSNYNYFTPEFVERLVEEACKEVGCICICSLEADEFGLFQELHFHDIADKNEAFSIKLRTKQSEMKATNEAQQMGATDTYSERYIKMKLFGIKDNSLDPDSKDNSKSASKSAPKKEDEPVAIWFDPKNPIHIQKVKEARDSGKDGDEIVKAIRGLKGWGISRVNAEDIVNGKI